VHFRTSVNGLQTLTWNFFSNLQSFSFQLGIECKPQLHCILVSIFGGLYAALCVGVFQLNTGIKVSTKYLVKAFLSSIR
jgi:hypothetical protein